MGPVTVEPTTEEILTRKVKTVFALRITSDDYLRLQGFFGQEIRRLRALADEIDKDPERRVTAQAVRANADHYQRMRDGLDAAWERAE